MTKEKLKKETNVNKRPRVRVAHLLSGREGGGITTVVLSLIENFDPGVIEASILLLSRNSIMKDRIGFKCHLIRKRLRGSPIAIFRVFLFCLRHDIDILHTHSVSSNFYGRIAGVWLPRTTVVTTIHARTFDELMGSFRYGILAWCIHRIDLWMHRFSRQIIAVSESLKKDLIANGVPEKKIHTIRHGIRMSSINVTEREVEEVRRRLNLDGNEKIVGIVGRLTWVKNHELFLRACKLVASKHRDLVLLIVGDGPLRKNLETLARNLSISETTIFTGWVAKVYPILHLLDLLVISSLSEGFGFILLEGMACGRAIVATRVSEIPWILEDGKTGILFPPNDINTCAEAIDYLLRHPQKRRQMGELARREISKKFPIDKEVESTMDVYLSTLTPHC